jgi:hypothetical protein
VFDAGLQGSGALTFARLEGGKTEVPPTAIANAPGSLPSLAFGSDGFGLALDAAQLGSGPASFTTLNSRGVASKPVYFGDRTQLTLLPDVAAGDREYAVTYTALTDRGVSVFFARFDERGTPRGEALSVTP